MNVKTACNLSRIGQAGCCDRKGRFLLAEKDEGGIFVGIYMGNGKWKEGSFFDRWINRKWQPIVPKDF